jgi:hypothetical protein
LHDTIALCFEDILETAGPGVKVIIDRLLSMKGISESDISTKFADVEKIVTDVFGAGGRLMMISTLSKICDEYSLKLDISYAASPHDRLEQLKDRILVERRLPKHYRKAVDTTSYEDTAGTRAPWSD